MSTSFRPKQSRTCVMIAERDTKTSHCYIKGCGSNVKGFTIAALDTKTIHCYIKGCGSNVKGFSPKVATNETTTLHQILCTRIALEQYKKQWSLS